MPRRKRRKSASSSVGLVLGGVAVLAVAFAIAGGFGYLYFSAASQTEIDAATLCPVTGPTSVTAILLDTTDPISQTTATDLKNRFNRLVADVPTGGMIQVLALTDQEGQLTETFTGCNPGSGAAADEWISNPRMIQERWEEGFAKPLERITSEFVSGTSGSQSPIMAAVQAINLRVFAPLSSQIPKQLVVASDLLEHTDNFSFYRSGADFSAFQESPAHAQYRTNLSGVSMRLLAFQRPDTRASYREVAEFWASWVTANDGEFTGIVPLEGV